jgi:HAD superfamily phosphatase (TIGR01681 family)
VLHLRWGEHCTECAFPSCYSTCSLYVERGDKNCARFAYGVYPNPHFSGHFKFGADILFRRWGKLEAALNGASVSIPVLPHAALELFDKIPLGLQNRLASWARRGPLDFDEFVIELYSPVSKPFRLILHYDAWDSGKQRIPYRDAFEVREGLNIFTVPFERFALDRGEGFRGFLRLFPEDTAGETRLIFTWLDFVKYKAGRSSGVVRTNSNCRPAPAAKVKCVAWDLDNTLWDGTLTEVPETDSLRLRPGVGKLIEALDGRGIIQTIVSKNDHTPAMAQLKRLGLADYFVYPAINWGQKSQNLKTIAERINISIDTFALLDDSAL